MDADGDGAAGQTDRDGPYDSTGKTKPNQSSIFPSHPSLSRSCWRWPMTNLLNLFHLHFRIIIAYDQYACLSEPAELGPLIGNLLDIWLVLTRKALAYYKSPIIIIFIPLIPVLSNLCNLKWKNASRDPHRPPSPLFDLFAKRPYFPAT